MTSAVPSNGTSGTSTTTVGVAVPAETLPEIRVDVAKPVIGVVVDLTEHYRAFEATMRVTPKQLSTGDLIYQQFETDKCVFVVKAVRESSDVGAHAITRALARLNPICVFYLGCGIVVVNDIVTGDLGDVVVCTNATKNAKNSSISALCGDEDKGADVVETTLALRDRLLMLVENTTTTQLLSRVMALLRSTDTKTDSKESQDRTSIPTSIPTSFNVRPGEAHSEGAIDRVRAKGPHGFCQAANLAKIPCAVLIGVDYFPNPASKLKTFRVASPLVLTKLHAVFHMFLQHPLFLDWVTPSKP